MADELRRTKYESTRSYTKWVLLAAVVVSLAGCGKKDVGSSVTASAPSAVRVKTVDVKAEPFSSTVNLTGTLVSRSRVDIKAETTGRVLRFPKEAGARVSAGEPIVWVDRESYQLAVRQAESAVQVAEANVERANVLEAHNRSELERARNLIQSGGITDKDLKSAELSAKDAKAQVGLAEAQLAEARAALAVGRKKLKDTVIAAPVAGEIEQKYVNPGAYVEPPTPVFSLVDNSRLELESPVSTADLAPVRAGQRVEFSVNAFPGETFSGNVIEINPAVDAQTRSAMVRIRIDNRGGKLRAGMFAVGQIVTGVERQAVLVPVSAVYRDDRSSKSAFVYVVVNGKAAKRTVEIGHETDVRLEIVKGLGSGDVLVPEQSIELADGVMVNPGK